MYGNFVHVTNDASHYTKPPTNFNEATNDGSGISWTICKLLAPDTQTRQQLITQFFTVRMLFLTRRPINNVKAL